MISKNLQKFSQSLEQFFLTVGQNSQNNFGNKISFTSTVGPFSDFLPIENRPKIFPLYSENIRFFYKPTTVVKLGLCNLICYNYCMCKIRLIHTK